MDAERKIADERFEKSKLIMQQRVEEHMNSLPKNFTAEASNKVHAIARINASAKVRLNKIYQLVDEYASLREPYVACREGCDSCCHMNVQITSIEADRISKRTGRKANLLHADTNHPLEKFAGMPCPFLANQRCTIYDDRPLPCRSHASFDIDRYWCDPARMNAVKLPMISMRDAQIAVREIAQDSQRMRIADIREFFS